MEIKKVIERINALYKKRKEEGLTEEEKLEEKELREIYLDNFRNNFRAQLDSIKVVHRQ